MKTTPLLFLKALPDCARGASDFSRRILKQALKAGYVRFRLRIPLSPLVFSREWTQTLWDRLRAGSAGTKALARHLHEEPAGRL